MGASPEQVGHGRPNGLRLSRIALLVAFCVVTALPFVNVLTSGVSDGRADLVRCVATTIAGLIVGWLYFRNLALAAATALAPLCATGMALVGLAHVRDLPPLTPALVYCFGFVAALVAGERWIVGVLGGLPEDAALTDVIRRGRRSLAALALFGVLAPWIFLAAAGEQGAAPAAAWLGAADLIALAGALAAVYVASGLVDAGEDFIANANRVRERAMRGIDVVAGVTERPWSHSLAGVFAVFVVVAYFGTGNVPEVRLVGGFALLALGGAAVILADWRRALAMAAVLAGSLLFGLWGFARAAFVPDRATALLLAGLAAIAFAIQTGVAARVSGTEPAAFRAALLDGGPAAAAAAPGVLFMLVPWLGAAPRGALGMALFVLFAGAGAVCFVPALADSLETVLPRRRPLADRYRVK